MRKPYCCEASQQLFDQYYSQQQKGNGDFPVYSGRAKQRGHGLGSMFSSLFKRVLPFLKKLAPIALRTGANIVDDVSKGKSFKDSAFDHVPKTLSKVVFGENNQSGSGSRGSNTYRKRRRKRGKRTAKRIKRDIFS